MAMVVQMHEGVAINKFKLDKPVLRIGRNPDSDIFIDNTVVSTEHAVIKTEDDPAADSGPASAPSPHWLRPGAGCHAGSFRLHNRHPHSA